MDASPTCAQFITLTAKNPDEAAAEFRQLCKKPQFINTDCGCTIPIFYGNMELPWQGVVEKYPLVSDLTLIETHSPVTSNGKRDVLKPLVRKELIGSCSSN